MLKPLKPIVVSILASSSFAWSACASSDKPAPVAEPDRVIGTAVAKLEARSGSEVTGTVTFTERQTTKNGVSTRVVDVRYDITGITPGETRGFHIHEVGDCSAPDASSAGPHFNPAHHEHGGMDHPMSHAGDLGNITANPAGHAEGLITDVTKFSFEGDTNIIGRAVVVHGKADDLTSQPAGNAGPRVACGVITVEP